MEDSDEDADFEDNESNSDSEEEENAKNYNQWYQNDTPVTRFLKEFYVKMHSNCRKGIQKQTQRSKLQLE